MSVVIIHRKSTEVVHTTQGFGLLDYFVLCGFHTMLSCTWASWHTSQEQGNAQAIPIWSQINSVHLITVPWQAMLNNSTTVTTLCSYIYPILEISSCSRRDLPISTWSCTMKGRPPSPTLWKLLCSTDSHINHPGMKAAPSSITHGRTQHSCYRALYFPTETNTCCRLEEKEVVSFHTPSLSINQWDALQILLKHCISCVCVCVWFDLFVCFNWSILNLSWGAEKGLEILQYRSLFQLFLPPDP